MNSERRLMLAVALSVLVILGYQAYMRQFIKPYHNDIVNDTVSPSSISDISHAIQQAPDTTGRGSETVSYNTSYLRNSVVEIAVTDYSAMVNSVEMLQYAAKDGQAYLLIASPPPRPGFLETDFLLPDNGTLKWAVKSHAADFVQYETIINGLIITKAIALDTTEPILTVRLGFENNTDDIKRTQYVLYNGSFETARGNVDSRYLGADVLVDGKVVRKRVSSKTIKGEERIVGSPQWVSTRGRHFSFIMKPGQDAKAVIVKSNSKYDLYTGIESNAISIMPHSALEHVFSIYAGPNDAKAMASFDATANAMINYGVFHGIGAILFKGMQMFFYLTKNYGVAIIMLSLVISLIMLPLTRKSLHSMKAMQKIQPETELIRKQYKDNPQKMNKEIMELYKKHKINPIGGCLPMLLQIPIFFSLYQVLLRSVELKGAHFLWIKDLSEPDAAFALPGAMRNLPFLGGYINLLPILMAIAMAFQQRLSQGGKEVSEQQRLMAGIMPIMFGLIFYNMPSGLVLYWFTNTIFMIVIQEVVLKSRKIGEAV
jgi:YidC/Oxa1 family membrane protein insertase